MAGYVSLKRILPDSPDVDLFRMVNDRSFPPNEHLEIDEMFEFNNMDIRVLGIYADDVFSGFFTVILSDSCVYICYFAIDPDLRGSGIGSAALQRLLEMFSDRQIVVDFEAYDEAGAPNPAERARRRAFYLRSGFKLTGNYMYYMDAEFEVACTREPMDENAYQLILNDIHLGAPEFPGKMYKRDACC